MNMYNEVLKTCPKCGGLGDMQIPLIALGTGSFHLDHPLSLMEISDDQRRELLSSVKKRLFTCRRCGESFGVKRSLSAVNADLLAACEWLVAQFEGESGAGASYWMEKPEFAAAKAAIAKARGESEAPLRPFNDEAIEKASKNMRQAIEEARKNPPEQPPQGTTLPISEWPGRDSESS